MNNNSISFLYVGDLHDRNTPPSNRKDNWEKTYNAKVLEIRNLAKEYKVKAILTPGDFFTRYKYDSEFLKTVLNRWGYKSYNEKLLQEGVIQKSPDEVPILTAIGNHDLLGNSLKTYPKTSLAFMESIGFLTIIDKEKPLIFKGDDFEVGITGGHFELDMDETKKPYIVENKSGDYHIHIVHGMLTDHKWPEGTPYTLVDEILETKADLTIAGHDHTGFPMIEHEGKMFVNPGSPTRMRVDEIKRKPKVMLVTVSKEKGIEIKYIHLKTALPGEDVLDTTKKESAQRKSNALKDVKERVKESTRLGSSIDEIIKSIAEESNLPSNISDKAIKDVEEKMSSQSSLSSINKSKSERYYIKTLQLTNFGSHESTTFEFEDGLNIFVGQTASGKTTCFRAFKWIYDDYGVSRRLIRRGKKSCEATITTSHGYVISRFITTKAKKSNDGKSIKNGYEIIHPNGDIEILNTKGVERVREILSYKKLDLESKNIDLNFLEQGDSWFFIGSKYTSTDRAKIIGAIHKTHYVDLVIKDLEAENKRLNQKREDKVKDSEKIQSEIESYDFLDKMKSNLKDINDKKDNLLKLIEKNNKLKDILEKQEDLESKMNECDNIINSINLANLNTIKEKINNIKSNLEHLKIVTRLIDKSEHLEKSIEKENEIINKIDILKLNNAKNILNESKADIEIYMKLNDMIYRSDLISKNISECDKIIESTDLEKISKSKNIINSVRENVNIFIKLTDLINKRNLILRNVQAMDNEMNKISEDKLIKCVNLINSIKSDISKFETLKKILQKRHLLETEVIRINQVIEKAKQTIELEIEDYKDLLVQNGKCPICDSGIDKITAQNIINKKKESLKI